MAKKQFIGPHEVLTIEPFGAKRVRVTYVDTELENGDIKTPSPQVFTKKCFAHVCTKKPTDFNDLAERMYAPLIEEIITSLMEYDVFFGTRDNLNNGLHFIFSKIENKLIGFRYLYEDKLWGKEEYEKTLLDIMEGLAAHADTSMDELKIKKSIPKGR